MMKLKWSPMDSVHMISYEHRAYNNLIGKSHEPMKWQSLPKECHRKAPIAPIVRRID